MAKGKKIVWSPTALEEKFDILDFWILNNQSITFSVKLDQEIEAAVDFLAEHPNTGRLLEDKIRLTLVREYQIFYEVTEMEILILSFWDGRQDPEKLKERLE